MVHYSTGIQKGNDFERFHAFTGVHGIFVVVVVVSNFEASSALEIVAFRILSRSKLLFAHTRPHIYKNTHCGII